MTSIKKIINEAVQEALDPVGKDEKGKKVGVGQIRDIDNDGDIDSSDEYLAYRRKKITQAMKNEDAVDGLKTQDWGTIPSEGELEYLMGNEEFDMDLQGADSLAFDYATELGPGLSGSTASPSALRATLIALVEAPEPSELDDDDYEDVEYILDEWYEKYPDESIQAAAWSLASSIMEVLGIEWI